MKTGLFQFQEHTLESSVTVRVVDLGHAGGASVMQQKHEATRLGEVDHFIAKVTLRHIEEQHSIVIGLLPLVGPRIQPASQKCNQSFLPI